MCGPPVYDLTNLLNDARRTVDPDIIQRGKISYGIGHNECEQLWYDYLSLHFHLRVIGQFIRVTVTLGKTGYLQHLPRLQTYIRNNMNPHFKAYCEHAGLDFSRELPPFAIEKLKPLIRHDAS
jgi:hypothetical protein